MNLLQKLKKVNMTIWIFIIFLGAFAVLNIVSKDKEFSESENRMLEQFPKFSAKSLFIDDKPWTLEFEDYFTDQFAMRSQWVSLRAAAEKAAGKTDNNEVYFAKNGYLISKPPAYSQDTIDVNVKNINEFASDYPNVSFALIPNSVCVNSSLLPSNAGNGDQQQLINSVYSSLSNVKTIDVLSVLKSHSYSRLYYRTDHHPTSLGAYYIYSALSEDMGFSPHPLDNYTVTTVSQSFDGTAKKRCGAWWISSDSIETFTLPDENYTLTISDGRQVKETYQSLYVAENLNLNDQYTMFLSGNAPLHIVSNPEGEGKLLIVMDSFSHCITPFLAAHYNEIHLVDLRYFRSSVRSYIQDNEINSILVLFSVENFASEKNFVFLNG